jgi:prevent-host-death family protein
MARTVGSRDLKTRLGTYLRLVRKGIDFIVTDRGRPVARLGPVGDAAADASGRLAEMAVTGQLSRASSEPLPAFRAAKVRGRPVSETIVKSREDRF